MSEGQRARPYAGAALGALLFGLLAVACVPAGVVAAVPGGIAVAAGVQSRRMLKREPQLQGARASLAGFALGVLAIALTVVPVLGSVALFAIAR